MFGTYKYGNATLTVEEDTTWVTNERTMSFNVSSSIMADKNGNLQFYTNGISINNKKHSTLKNGNRINPGKYLDDGGWTQYDVGGLPLNQGVLSIPSPNDDNKYFIFNTDINVVHTYNPLIGWVVSPEFYYQKIDMTKNNGLGEVIELNKLITNDTLDPGSLTSCQHGNGRDWWINVNKWRTNTYKQYLLNDTGVVYIGKQKLDSFRIKEMGFSSTSMYSNDGKKFIRIDDGNPTVINIADFDRCSGVLSNTKQYRIPVNEVLLSSFSSISSNSRFLYIVLFEKILQFDLEAPDLLASVDTVAIYDGFFSPINGCQTKFFQSWLGPDGKIYICTATCSTNYLHVIENPDLKGKACNVKQHSINLNKVNSFTAPNFPNYRLGPLKGSPCDTVSVATKDIKPEDYGIKLFPNPSSTIIKIDISIPQYDPTIKTEVVVVDVSGAIVMRYVMPDFAYLATLDISKLPSGVYGVQLRQPQKSGERVLATEKLVVIE